MEPLRLCAQRLPPYLLGRLAEYQSPLGTSLIEDINNRIKLIKRMSRGFRYDACMFLNIPAPSLKLGEEPRKPNWNP